MIFAYVLGDILHLVKFIVLCDMFFVFQRRVTGYNKRMMAVAGLIMTPASLFIYFYNNEFAEMFVYAVVIVALMCMLYREKFHRIVIVSIGLIFAFSMLDTMTDILVETTMELIQVNGEEIAKIGAAIVSLVLVYIAGRVFQKNSAIGMKTFGTVPLLGLTLLIGVDTIVVTVAAVTNSQFRFEKNKSLYLVAVILTILGIFVQLIAVITLLAQRNIYREKKQLTEKYLDEQKTYYEYLEKRERETKKFRHDFRSHMELISTMVKNQEYDKIEDYLEKMHIRMEELGNNVTVQNGIVDAVLNQYYAKAGQQGVTLEVKGRFPADCKIDAFDICTIFSNILSNALEASAETEKKHMSIECRYNDTKVIIVAKNSFYNNRKTAGTLLKSQKGNMDYHGFGLENMKDSIAKYNGVFDIETKDDLFILTIMFDNVRE